MRTLTGSVVLVVLCLGAGLTAAPEPPRVRANDNRAAAGTRRGDTLVLNLEVRLARWYPEADDGPSVVVPVFAVRGRVPEVPGPLIRVPTGTQIDVTVENGLADSTVTIHGLVSHPGADDSVRLAPGASRRLQFAAGVPGTYLYWGTAGTRYHTTAAGRRDSLEREQLAGAFVVDSGAAPPNDRVFVINIWGQPRDSTATSPEIRRSAMTINGKAWPYTERLTFTAGDSVRWRWINASSRMHPMHLHGFYFRVHAKGGALRDSMIPQPLRSLAVTDEMRPRTTSALAWLPTRPGNWLFHCHIAFHVLPPVARLDSSAQGAHGAHHMAGLVLGLEVRPAVDWVEPARRSPRSLTFRIRELDARGRSPRTIGVAIAERGGGSDLRTPGPPLVLTRGEPTDVTVLNELAEETAIHWHGLELESYSDGVVSWSGSAARLAPAIAPADSFVARLTQPRAGTFIYHTHLHDLSQLTAGLYGPIVVLEPGERFDPSRDHVFVVGWDGPQVRPINILLNGDSVPPPLELARGVSHRLRFINIGPAQRLRFALLRDSTLATWRPIAADGATLPEARAVAGPATTILPVGTTLDVEFLAPAAGEYRLTLALPLPGARPVVTQRLVVR